MPAEKPHSVRWATYGIQSSGRGQRSVTRDFQSEEAAVAFLMQAVMTAAADAVTNAVVAKVEKWPVEGPMGKFIEVPSVVLRLGRGRGWWEGGAGVGDRIK